MTVDINVNVPLPPFYRVYIAGPMSGYPMRNADAFNEAEDALRELTDWLIINPVDNFGGNTHLPWQVYMRRALHQVADSDAIVLLPGWQLSRGARLERRVAKGLGLDIIRWTDLVVPDGE